MFFRLGEVFLAFASGLTMLVTFGTPYWVEQSIPVEGGGVGGVEQAVMYHSGLWQNCTLSQGCESIGLRAPSEWCVCVRSASVCTTCIRLLFVSWPLIVPCVHT